MMTICPLCQQVHLHPLQDKLCKVRLQIINLRLEERQLIRQLKNVESVSYCEKLALANIELTSNPTDSANVPE
jgi:hypothetical protein